MVPLCKNLLLWMPPTRGHDLKQPLPSCTVYRKGDAPHTGARLETLYEADLTIRWLKMPPTRGHDLKPERPETRRKEQPDAPPTGARLETAP